MKPLKIFHITDLHLRHNGRLFYSTGKKLNNGLILNGHNVLNLSDRDITSQKKDIFDIGAKKFLLDGLVAVVCGDCHSVDDVRPAYGKGLEQLRILGGDYAVDRLLKRNPASLLAGKEVDPWVPV